MCLCIVKKIDSIRTKLTEEIDFEVCPYGDSGNGTAAAARCSGRKNQPACLIYQLPINEHVCANF